MSSQDGSDKIIKSITKHTNQHNNNIFINHLITSRLVNEIQNRIVSCRFGQETSYSFSITYFYRISIFKTFRSLSHLQYSFELIPLIDCLFV